MSRESTGYQRQWPRSRMAKTRLKLETGNINLNFLICELCFQA